MYQTTIQTEVQGWQPWTPQVQESIPHYQYLAYPANESPLWQPQNDIPTTISTCGPVSPPVDQLIEDSRITECSWHPFPIRNQEEFEIVDEILAQDLNKWHQLVSFLLLALQLNLL